MSDLRSMTSKPTSSKETAEQLDQMRKNIGAGFTDKPTDKKKRNEMGKDDFMKLMSAQLKYQDPTSPMKNEEMAAQLAQFSSLEQMFNVNQNLEKMTRGQKPQENVMAATLIGKKISTDGSRILLEKDKTSEMHFDLPEAVAKGSVSVVNAKGEVVREISLLGAKKGTQVLHWDGKSDKGLTQDPGEYNFRITAMDKNDKPIQASLSNSGLVTGVSFEKGRALLLVGDKKIPMDAVSQIEEVSAKDVAEAVSGEAIGAAKTAKTPTPVAGAEKNKIVETDKQKNLSQTKPQGKIDSRSASSEAIAKEPVAPQEVTASVEEPSEDLSMNVNPELSGNTLWNPNN